jgi:3-phenylpropionate/trans-cinnamate dioxygenase ferredoxin reductase component
MAVRDVDFLNIDGGVAAGKAAEGIREGSGQGSVVVMTAEQELPYERPPLSKEFLRGEVGREKTRTHDEAWYRDHEVEVMMATRASALDPGTRTVTTEVGDQLRYGRLPLATGARVIPLGLPGEDLAGVFYLRTVDDSEQLREAIRRAGRMVVIGGGFIGAEVAASATQMDTQVTLLEVADTLWTRAVGPQLGRFFEEFLRDRGVDVRVRVKAARVEGDGKVEAVVLEDGTRIPAEVVVIGVRPAIELAEAAGLPIDNGITVDEQRRAGRGGPARRRRRPADRAVRSSLTRHVDQARKGPPRRPGGPRQREGPQKAYYCFLASFCDPCANHISSPVHRRAP